jgi:hypothetical protein
VLGDQSLRELRVKPPIASSLRIGERGARHRLVDAQVIDLAGLRGQTGFDVAQTFPIGELREGHHEKVLRARQRPNSMIGIVAIGGALK